MKEKRVLPADVFDTLEFSVLAAKGIGAPSVYKGNPCGSRPNCLYGHAEFASNAGPKSLFDNPIADALVRIIRPDESDQAVFEINRRKKVSGLAPVSWAEYTKETGLTRGE
jgi:hypothetical protein